MINSRTIFFQSAVFYAYIVYCNLLWPNPVTKTKYQTRINIRQLNSIQRTLHTARIIFSAN